MTYYILRWKKVKAPAMAVGGIIEIVRPAPVQVSTAPRQIAEDCRVSAAHMDYGSQLEWKRQKAADALTRIGKFQEPRVRPVIGMADHQGYRNKSSASSGSS